MKYDLAKKMTKGAKRTLNAFTSTMLELLSIKSFQEITVNELCDRSHYPRATFYNYFDDKFDLLGYCWHRLYQLVDLDDAGTLNSEEKLFALFERAYDLAATHQHVLRAILRHNSEKDFLYYHFRMHLASKIREFFIEHSCAELYEVPYEIVVDHYCNTALLVLEWRFLKENDASKAQAQQYLKFLIGSMK